jgi:NADPH-dependent ferric siderophore reductase
MRNRILEAFFIRATVIAVAEIGRFRYVRLRSPRLVTVAWVPGQQVRVDCGRTNALIPLLRTYSVWDHQEDWIDLYCLVHGDGPGSRWAAGVAVGDSVLISKPKGDLVTRTAGFHLFVGDEIAAAAFGPMVRALPTGVSVQLIVNAADSERLPMPRDVTWIPRDAGTPVDTPALVESVAKAEIPDQGEAYLAGEGRMIHAVREVLVNERRWPRGSIHAKAFWTPGRRGME